MPYKYIGTDQQLDDRYFEKNEQDEWVRGGGMGWAHKVNKETKMIEFVDKEHAAARDNYEKAGGMKAFISDLIREKLVEVS